MADQTVRIYLKGGAVIEFVADGFWVDRGGEKWPGSKIGMLNMGRTDMDLEFIDTEQIAAITKTKAPSK